MIRLGIDYGTSTSKMVFRDALAPGGEKAFAVVGQNGLRISSSIKRTRTELWFGEEPAGDPDGAAWFHSTKMRVAGEVTGDYTRYCFGTQPMLPDGITARDLAIGTLWFLMTVGQSAIQNYLRTLRRADPQIAITVGLPMSFFEAVHLRKTFLKLVLSAEWLFRNTPARSQWRIPISEFKQFISSIDREFVHTPIRDADLRDFIRPEAEAAMCLPAKSPSVGEGPYAEVDIGAGTTNASIFSILPRFDGQRWINERLAFFGAHSVPVGMDAIDVAIARRQADENWYAIRSHENRFLAGRGHQYASVLEGIREAYMMAWRRAAPKLHHPERERFRTHQIFVTGGGSLVPEVTQVLREHPEGFGALRLRHLESPNDLWASHDQRISSADVPFLAAAYGLSFDALELPPADTPDMIEPAPPLPTRPFIHYED